MPLPSAKLHLRLATPDDAEALAAIYRPYVLDTTVSFETEAPNEAEMARRIRAGSDAGFPWLVCEAEGAVRAYAYAGRLAERHGYDWSAAVSIYVDGSFRRGGLGQRLYAALEALLALQGYRTAYGILTSPNPPSEAFHERMGYERQGLLKTAGYKFGKPLGAAYYAKPLLPVADNPSPPVPLGKLPPGAVDAILAEHSLC